MPNRKVRVVVTINVPSDIEADLLINDQEFMSLAGKAVQAVAAQAQGANPDPRWLDGRGSHVTSHIHTGENGCSECRMRLYNDDIE